MFQDTEVMITVVMFIEIQVLLKKKTHAGEGWTLEILEETTREKSPYCNIYL